MEIIILLWFLLNSVLFAHSNYIELSKKFTVTISKLATDRVILPPIVHQQGGRKKHSHTCIEMSYVLSGNASHIIRHADGTEQRTSISMGSYYILDHNVSHIIFDVSKDFFLVNVLFKPSFINPAFTQY